MYALAAFLFCNPTVIFFYKLKYNKNKLKNKTKTEHSGIF